MFKVIRWNNINVYNLYKTTICIYIMLYTKITKILPY